MDSPAEGPDVMSEAYSFAKTLLDLLRNACDTCGSPHRQLPASPSALSENARVPQSKHKKHAPPVTPLSLCMHLVSATAACYQHCDLPEERQKLCHEENDRIMSKIPHDASAWSVDLLSHLQVLILEAVVAVCLVALEEKSDLEVVLNHDNILSLTRLARSVLDNGGLVLEDQDSPGMVDIPSGHTNGLPHLEVSCPKIPLENRAISNAVFASDTLKSLFSAISESLTPPALVSPGEVTGTVAMLHEFEYCGGFVVLEKVMRVFVGQMEGTTKDENPHPMQSAANLSPGQAKRGRCVSTVCVDAEQNVRQLLKSWEDLLRLLKRAKTEYIHQVTCTKLSHRRCDLTSVVHHHHDIIGVGFSRYARMMKTFKKHSEKTTSRWSLQSRFSDKESPRTRGRTKHNIRPPNDTLPPPCVVMATIKFILEKLMPLSEAFARLFVTSIDRIGVCHCANPGCVAVPLLSYLPSMNPQTQDTTLAVIGRIFLQRTVQTLQKPNKNAEDSKHKEKERMPETIQLSEMVSAVEIRHFSSSHSHSHQENHGDVKMEPKSTPHISNGIISESILTESQEHPWLCLSVYKNFLLGKHDHDGAAAKESSADSSTNLGIPLSIKIARHLSSVAPHFELNQALILLTTVLLPVLRHISEQCNINEKGSRSSRKRKRRRHTNSETATTSAEKQDQKEEDRRVSPDVAICCLKVLKHHLAACANFRRAFIRHSCLRPVTSLLLNCQTSISVPGLESAPQMCFADWTEYNCKEISELCGDVLTISLSAPVDLSSKAEVLVLRFDDTKVATSLDSVYDGTKPRDDSDEEQDGLIGSVIKGFTSLTKLSPRQQRRFSPFRTRSPDSRKGHRTDATPWTVKTVNESAVFHADVVKFTCALIQNISDLTLSPDTDLRCVPVRPRSRSVSLRSEDLRTDLEATLSSSDTTGYHSRSRDSSFDMSNRCQKLDDSSDEDAGYLDVDLEEIYLPLNDKKKMKDLCHICSILSPILQENADVYNAFSKFTGFDVILHLLTFVTSSLIPANYKLDFTSTSSEAASPNRSLRHSLDEQAKLQYQSLGDTSESNLLTMQAEISLNSESKSVLSSTPNDASFNAGMESVIESIENESLNDAVAGTSNVGCTAETDQSVSRKVVPEEGDVDEEMMEMKFQLLSSTLTMALLGCDDADACDDIIGTLKPLLQQSQLASGKHCLSLCKCLFEAAVRQPFPDQPDVKINETLMALKQQILSPRKTAASPGRQRFSAASFPYDSPLVARRLDRRRLDSVGSESNFSEADDNSSVYDVMMDMEQVLDSDEEVTTDGYQGDSESDKPGFSMARSPGWVSPVSTPDLVQEGVIEYPKLITLMLELLGAAGEKFDVQDKAPSSVVTAISQEEHIDNVRVVARTITSLVKHSSENLDVLSVGCDLPLACLESFKNILQHNADKEKDIRQNLLEVCLSLNKKRMTARHLRLILSFFNSEDPPLDQLLRYLLLLIQHELPGPSQYLQFPVPDLASTSTQPKTDSGGHLWENMGPYSMSVWKVAPLRLHVGSRVVWPASNMGVSVSLWLHVGTAASTPMEKDPTMQSWDSSRIVVIDIDHAPGPRAAKSEMGGPGVSSPYNHLVSIGTKQSMLQLWLDHSTLIFRVCVDPDDSKPVGVLAQTDCDGLITSGEWQHLTFTYTENKLPDKTILGKVHVIANCTTERDVILEHNLPKQSGRMTGSYRRHAAQEPRDVNLFLGHITRENWDKQSQTDDFGYKLGPVMLFDGVHFSLKSAFAIFSKGPNVSNLTECLVSETNSENRRKSSASVSSRVRFSSSCSQICGTLTSPLSPTPGAGSCHSFLLPHSLLLSDLVPEEFFCGENVPDVRKLQEYLVLSHSPTDPGCFLLNHMNTNARESDRRSKSFSLFSSPSSDEASASEAFDPLTQQCIRMPAKKLARVKPQWNRGLHRALNQVGGIRVFLLMCAKVVEVTSHSLKKGATPEDARAAEMMQCLALQALLRLRAADSKRQHEFTRQNVAAMLHKLLTKSQCIVGFHTLQILMNAACSGDVVIENIADDEDEGHFQVNYENSAIIRDQKILQVFLTDWRVWHKARGFADDEEYEFPVWSMLLDGLLSLVRDEHHYQWYNLRVLLRAGVVQKILTGLQQMITDGVTPFPGPRVTSSMVELVRALTGSPPDTGVLTLICDFLVATHPPAGTFVCHAASSFYFNLQSARRQKEASSSNPTSPTEKSEVDRPTTSRSVSAPVGLPRRSTSGSDVSVGSFHSITPNSLRQGAFEAAEIVDSTPDDQQRRAKALSIIQEGQSSESASSSRNTTPSHVSFSGVRTNGAGGGDDAHDTSNSWEEVPHDVTPIAVPAALQNALLEKTLDMSHPTPEPETILNEEIVKNMAESPFSETDTKTSNDENASRLNDEDNGMSYVTCELLNLLFVAVMTMPEKDVLQLTSGPLHAGALIVGVHHKSSRVRTMAVRMLSAYFSRCSHACQDDFIKQKGFHLVANQLHQHKTTRSLVDACLYVLLGHPASCSEPLPLDGSAPDPGMLPTPAPNPFTNHAAVLLLAVLENSTHDFDLCRDLVIRLLELFDCMGPVADVMLDNGLTLALCNLITAVMCQTCPLNAVQKEGVVEEVEHFMTCIAVKACVTAGTAHFQVFEDLFTLLYVIEKDQAGIETLQGSKNVVRIQAISYHILTMVMELMQKSAIGKSPVVPRTLGLLASRLPSESSGTRTPSTRSQVSSLTFSRQSSLTQSAIEEYVYNPKEPRPNENGLASPEAEYPPSFPSHHRGSVPVGLVNGRHDTVSSAVENPRHHRRSLSGSHSISSDSSVVFRPHGGGLRTRSFKGSQRRRINEAETARRLQRVVMIAADKIIFNDQKPTAPKNGDKDATFPTLVTPAHGDKESERDVFDEELNSFVHHLFHKMTDWLTAITVGNARPGGGVSRSGSVSSGRVPNSVQGWERILTLSRESLVDQMVRLLTYLLSPLEPDLRVRLLPFSLLRKQGGERVLATLFPKDSKHGKKVSVYLYYLLCYYKQQMTSQERKDIKLFYRAFRRCGHKLYPLPQTPNGVAGKEHKRRPSLIRERTSSESQALLMETLQKNQAAFDSERKREVQNWRMQNNASYMQLKLRTDHLSQIVSQHAMDVTQQVVLRQNIERKKMIAHMKDVISNDLSVRKQWAGLLEQLAHERAVWYDARRYPKSWQLDSTEGPNRERRRLQRCHLGIEERFMMKKSEQSKQKEIERKKLLQKKIKEMVENGFVKEEVEEKKEEPSLLKKRPLSFLFEDDSHSSDSITIRTRLQTNERISMVQSCTNVTPSCETPGEILIGESNMYFVGDEVISDLSLTQALFGECEVLVLSWRHEEVAEVHKRWWQLQDIAIEIFLTNGKTYLVAFKSVQDRDIIVSQLNRVDLPNLLVRDSDVQTLTQMWRNGAMTNFEYLTQLNKSAGRSFNDLMQYPVMPFVLADYTSAILDLNNLDSFRNLHRPISVPDDTRLKHYRDRYKFLMDDYNNCTEDERELKTAPFHYGSHYSNSGTVLHFLVRLPPYTQMFLEYQDSSFDIPDRTFHSMETTFRLSSYSSTTDVKELVPEFFFLPEFLCNLEGFDFGLRQCGLRVNHVILPPWSKADPRLFVLIHRQALESDYVSSSLHAWVDLVFGYKQTGKEAIEAVNVFHPATYFGMDISSVEDPVKRKALETMVKTYGQTPKQLFTSPHPARFIRTEPKDTLPARRSNDSRRSSLVPSGRSTPIMDRPANRQKSSPTVEQNGKMSDDKVLQPQRPLSSVLGLKWGSYLGSPSAPEPAIFLHKTLSDPAGSLIPLQTNDVCALAARMGLLVIYNRERGVRSFKSVDIRWSALLTYGHPDNLVRLKMRKTLPDVNLLRTPADDHVTCCAIAPDCRAIVLGHKSGAISVNRCNPQPDKAFDLELMRGTTLYGHVADITCLVACGEFRILASGSRDGTVVLWDLDALTYIRSLTGHATAVSTMAISRTTGDVCTVCDSGNDEGSHIRLWTINGSLLAAQDTKRRVGCVAFSNAPEGISVNVIAGGMSNGVIRMWSTWDLTPVRDIETHGVTDPITCITFTHNSKVLYAATSEGQVIGWCFKDRLDEKQPILISFLNVCEKT